MVNKTKKLALQSWITCSLKLGKPGWAGIGLALFAGLASAGTERTALAFPVPSTISQEAQEFLSGKPSLLHSLPIPQSEQEWLSLQSGLESQFQPAVEKMIKRHGVSVSERKIAGVNVHEITPAVVSQEHNDKILLYLHGGGYVILGGKSGIRDAITTAALGKIKIIAVDYRMPPQHPFPAAVDDVMQVYKSLLIQYPVETIAVFGSSAGAGLATAFGVAARDAGLPLPAAFALNSPWSDLTKTGDSYYTLAGLDHRLPSYDGLLKSMAKLYANGMDLKNPGLSPVYADFTAGFAPTFLVSGTRDMFLSNTIRQHRAFRRAGVVAELHVFEGMWHAFREVPEQHEAILEMIAFFDRHFDSGSAEKKSRLAAIVEGRGESARARDRWRNPLETLRFFELEEDDFVIEMMPGAAMWYTDIIAPYVAEKGRYGAVAYEYDMVVDFLINPSEERLRRFREWPRKFPGEVGDKYAFKQQPIAFEFRQVPQAIVGKVDKVLMIRELHNYYRVRKENDYLEQTLKDTYAMLKPGGILGVVQHRAPESADGVAGDGSYGYIKQSNMIAEIEAAGFVLEATSEINANPADRPGSEARESGLEGIVWRLPPTYYYKDKGRDLFESVGESDRMTLKFRKPL